MQMIQEPYPPTRYLDFGEWRDGGRAPYEMGRGAAVVGGNVAYFMSWNGQTCSYHSSTVHSGGVSFLSVPIPTAF